MLDETDQIWQLIRHWHFAEAVDYILNSFSKFLNENKAASTALGGNKVYDSLK
jgi:syntaxin-binding protein 1